MTMQTSQRAGLPATPRRTHLAQVAHAALQDSTTKTVRVHPFKKASTAIEKPGKDSARGKNEIEGIRHNLKNIQQAVWSRATENASRIGDLAWGQDGCPVGDNDEVRRQSQSLAQRYALNRTLTADDGIEAMLDQLMTRSAEADNSSDCIVTEQRREIARAQTAPHCDVYDAFESERSKGSKDSTSSKVSEESAMGRWLARREERKARMGRKMSYGQLLRAEHEQTLSNHSV